MYDNVRRDILAAWGPPAQLMSSFALTKSTYWRARTLQRIYGLRASKET